MNRILLAATLFLGLGCTSLPAQTMGMQVNIPFNFEVNKSQLPAGKYLVRLANGVITVQQLDGQAGVIALSTPEQRAERLQQRKIVFHRYGDTYFLKSVHTPETQTAASLAPSRKEREMASRGEKASQATLAASQR